MKKNFFLDPNKHYTRRDDMSPDETLSIYAQPDGDIVVMIHYKEMCEDYLRVAQVEFCNPFAGGGRSPRVREALVNLAAAIEEDNMKHPI